TTPAKLEILSYVVNVSANGTWTSSQQVRTTFGGSVTTNTNTDGGTYTLSGNNVAITSNTAGSTVQAGVIPGNTLTLSQSGFIFVFTKQSRRARKRRRDRLSNEPRAGVFYFSGQGEIRTLD